MTYRVRTTVLIESAEVLQIHLENQANHLGNPTAALRAGTIALSEYLAKCVLLADEEGAKDLARALRKACAPLVKVNEALLAADEGVAG